MKLSISNIAWFSEHDNYMYKLMHNKNFFGLEIAPTRLIPEEPYNHIEKAIQIKDRLSQYAIKVSSMQSIWYGREEKIFGSDSERKILVEYTKSAIKFAESIKCNNLVFGCPRNRNLIEGEDPISSISFFKELGDYAWEHGTVLALEANPTIYNTNYINTTAEAIELIKKVNSPGFLLNLDVGTIIQNEETLDNISYYADIINHVHISEPRLIPIKKRALHKELAKLLKRANYTGYISIEMGKQENMFIIENVMDYVREVFG